MVSFASLLIPFLFAAGKDGPLLDHHGDPLPPGAVARLGTTRFRQGSHFTCMALAPNGKTILSGCPGDRSLMLWEAATGRPLRQLGEHPAVMAVAFSPDGKQAASGGIDQAVRVWDVEAGKKKYEFKVGGVQFPNSVAFAPDGKSLAAATHLIQVWDLATGREKQWLLPDHFERLSCTAFSPDGKTLLTGGDKRVYVWDPATGKQLGSLQGDDQGIMAIVFAGDGKTFFTCGLDKSIRVWDLGRGKESVLIGKHPFDPQQSVGWLRALAVSPDGKRAASAGFSSEAVLWDVEARKAVRRFGPHPSPVYGAAFTRDGKRLVTAGETIRIWDVATGKELLPFTGHHGAVNSLSLSPDGKTAVTAGRDGVLRFWDMAATKEVRHRIAGRDHGITEGFTSVRFSPDGKLLAAAMDGAHSSVPLWEAATGKLVRRFSWKSHDANCLAFSPDGELLAIATAEPRLYLREVHTGKKRWEAKEDGAWATALAFSPCGQYLAAGGFHDCLRLFQVKTGREVRRIDAFQRTGKGTFISIECKDVTFSADGTLIALASSTGTVLVYDVATGKEKWSVKEHLGWALAAAFSPDGRTLASGGWDKTVQLWEVATGKPRLTLTGHRGPVNSVRFTRDGRRLLSGSEDTTALVWDLPSLARPARMPGVEGFAELWDSLADMNADRALRASAAFRSVPERSLPWLMERLRPVASADGQRLSRLIAGLDGKDYKIRVRAMRELEEIGEPAAAALRAAVEKGPTLELRRRVEELLAKLDPLSPQGLREGRTIEMLEWLAAPEARAFLNSLARGVPEARRTREAKAALRRLSTQSGGGN